MANFQKKEYYILSTLLTYLLKFPTTSIILNSNKKAKQEKQTHIG